MSLNMPSALAVRSPMANGMMTHNATSTNRAPNLKKLGFLFDCFIFIYLLDSSDFRTVVEEESFPQSGYAKSQCEDEDSKDRQ